MQRLRPEQIADNWNLVATRYSEHIDPITSAYAAEALKLAPVEKGEAIIDIAAGAGALALRAARRGADVFAIDFSRTMVESLRHRAKGEGLPMRVEEMDGQALDIPDQMFDGAYSVFGAMIFPDRAKGFSEMHRVVKRGGRGVVVTWDAIAHNEWMQLFVGSLKKALPDMPDPEPPQFMELADPVRLRSEMEQAGFADVEVRTVAPETVFLSPEAEWTAIAEANPAFPSMLANLGKEGAAKVRDVFLDEARKKAQSDGKLHMRAQAHVAVGRKE